MELAYRFRGSVSPLSLRWEHDLLQTDMVLEELRVPPTVLKEARKLAFRQFGRGS